MNFPKRNKVNYKRFPYKIICLMLFLAIVMMKIVSYTCQDLAGSISNNGVSKTVFSIPVDNLWPCGGKPNCYYQYNSKNCTKMTQLSIRLSLTGLGGLKPPPLIVTLSTVMKKNRRRLFKDPYNVMDQNKPLELILCDKRLDMLQWAKTSVIGNTSLPPTLNMVFTIVYPDSKRVHKIKTVALEFSSIFIVNFNDPPECVLVDDLNHKVFWSDGNRGIIEAYDTKTNKINVLAKFLDMPRSMVIDSTLGLLFWCNFENTGRGSIERVNFDGGNRVEITKGKYDLAYPETLGIDLTKRMLYWTDHQVIHTSDYDGNYHEIVVKSDFYDPNFPGCFSFAADVVEHNFFWENRQLQHFNRSFVPNHLLSLSYQKDGEDKTSVIANTSSPPTLNIVFTIVYPNSKRVHKIKTAALEFSSIFIVNFNDPPECVLVDDLNHKVFWSDGNRDTIETYDTKTNKINVLAKFFDMSRSKIIDSNLGLLFWCNFENTGRGSIERVNFDGGNRFVIYVVQDMNKTVTYKYESKYVISYVLENINVYISNLIIFDLIEKSFYFLNTTSNWTKIFDFDGTNGRRYLEPNIFSYITQVMDYNNNAQSHTTSVHKYVLTTIYKLVLQSLMISIVGCKVNQI